MGEGEVAAEEAEADGVAVDFEAGGCDHGPVFIGDEVGVGAFGVDAGDGEGAGGEDAEFAGGCDFGWGADALAGPVFVGFGELPAGFRVGFVVGAAGGEFFADFVEPVD